MTVRQANKIQKQHPPCETDKRSRSWWNRYNKAYAYTDKLYRNIFTKRRKEGKLTLWSNEEIDKMITDILNEYEQ